VIVRMAGLAEKAGRIIQHVNAFARRRELSKQRLDLAALLRRVLAGNADNPIWVEADEMLLEHLIGNLVGNAWDWAHKSSMAPCVRVVLQADIDQGMAAIAVADSGPGVAPQD
jgi:two-component system, LuxR family, sensor histidine kinase DctS